MPAVSALLAGYCARMSGDHVEIVRRQYDAFAARDWETLAELWHPEIEYVTVEKAAGVSGSYRGLEQITEFFDSWSDLYSEFRVEAAEIVAVGDRVVVAERQAARGLKGSRAEAWVQDSFACLIAFEDGQVRRIEEFPTLDAAVAAAEQGQ